jgi:DNA-directed RNA polymerase subunit RPC12/RpoP
MTDLRNQSPTIYRCALCGALVHPSDPERPVAWCGRCSRPVPATEDGGLAGA